MSEITPEKKALLDQALASPDDENSQVIIQKARERGWIPQESVPNQASTQAEPTMGEAIKQGAHEGATVFGVGKDWENIAEAAASEKPFMQAWMQADTREAEKTKQLQEKFPKAYWGSRIAATTGVLAPFLAEATSPLAIIGSSAALGGLESAAKTGDPKEAAKGTAMGGVMGALGLGASKVASQAMKPLVKASKESIIKALQFPPTVLRRMKIRGDVLGKARKVAEDIIDAGVMGEKATPTTLKGLYKRTAESLDGLGKELGGLFNQADDLGIKISRSDIEREIFSGLKSEFRNAKPGELESVVQDVLERIPMKKVKSEAYLGADLGQEQALTPSQLWNEVKGIDKISREYTRASSTDPSFGSKADYYSHAAKSIRKVIGDNISQVSPELGDSISKVSGAWSSLSIAEDSLAGAVQREFSKNRSMPRGSFYDEVKNYVFSTPARMSFQTAVPLAEKGAVGSLRAGAAASTPFIGKQ